MIDFNFDTGPSTLPDIGKVSYNGCIFSPLFQTTLSGEATKDKAGRTIKFITYSLEVDGYVTLALFEQDVNNTMRKLREQLQQQAGELIYQGRGFNLEVNVANGNAKDVAWGPIPEILEFQPLGSGRSAKIRWRVVTRVTEPAVTVQKLSSGRAKGAPALLLLQFNYETSVSYYEDQFSSLSARGTIEIAMTRSPDQKSRKLVQTVDDIRYIVGNSIMAGIDLARFRLTRREFNISRDKRTLEFEFVAEETPYMDMPPDCTIARGTYSVRPVEIGPGLVRWSCTLKATYTVRNDKPRRTAWLAFLALLRLRMASAKKDFIPEDGAEDPEEGTWTFLKRNTNEFFNKIIPGPDINIIKMLGFELKKTDQSAWLWDFQFDEGLYLDSKTISFSATWRMVASFRFILLASGLWKKVQELANPAKPNTEDNNLWAISMRDILKGRSWLANELDPALDVIVDFGG